MADTNELGALGQAASGGRGLIASMSGMAGPESGVPPELMGALSSVMDPRREQRRADAAFVEGYLAPSASGGSAFLSNAMAAQRTAEENSDKLKAQYIPLIMQSLVQQRQAQLQAAQFGAQQLEKVMPVINTNLAALKLDPNADLARAHQTVDATLAQYNIPPQYGQPVKQWINSRATTPDGQFNPDGFNSLLQEAAARAPTDALKNLLAGGMNSAQIAAKLGTELVRPEQVAAGPDKEGKFQTSYIAPDVGRNINPQVSGNGQVSVTGVPGAINAVTALEAGKEGVRIGNVTTPSGATVPARLGPAAGAAAPQLGLPAGAGGGGGGAPVAPRAAAPVPVQNAAPAPVQQAQAAPKVVAPANPLAPAQGTPTTPVGIGQSTAAQATATGTAKDAVEAYNELHNFATTSAPRNIGLLQSIYQLADKTLTGPGANKIQFVNGVLNTLGITPTADAAQNYQIMQKNLGMLVASQRMGARGGGSDALQTLLQASNPNVDSMNAPAAKEAAAELIAYNRMMIDKNRLAPNPNTTTPQAYAEFETKFAPFNDPRIWQMHHAENDKERKRLLSLIPAQDRLDFLHRAEVAVGNKIVGGR